MLEGTTIILLLPSKFWLVISKQIDANTNLLHPPMGQIVNLQEAHPSRNQMSEGQQHDSSTFCIL